MAEDFCPGAKFFKNPQPTFKNCPNCNCEVEIWTDEIKAICPKCKKTVLREAVPTCLDWCKFAKECVGEQEFKKYNKEKEEGEKHKKKN